MSDSRPDLIPNSFQCPNAYVDEVLPHLTGAETKVLLFLVRKTFGWRERECHLSKAEISAGAGVGRTQTYQAVDHLVALGVVQREEVAGHASIYTLELDPARFRLPGDDDEPGVEVRKPELALGAVSENDQGCVRKQAGVRPETGRGTPYPVNPLTKPTSETHCRERRARDPESTIRNPRDRVPVPKPGERERLERAACPVWAALVATVGGEPAPGKELEAWRQVWLGMRERPDATPAEIAVRAERWQRGPWGRRGIVFTVPGLWANWTALGTEPPPATAGHAPRARAPTGDPFVDGLSAKGRATLEASAIVSAILPPSKRRS